MVQEIYGSRRGRTGIIDRVYNTMITISRINRRLNTGMFDIIHINSSNDPRGLFRDFIILSFIRPHNTRVFIKFHGTDDDLLRSNNRIIRFMLRKVEQRADGFGVLSKDDYLKYCSAGFAKEKLFIVKNSIRPGIYEKDNAFRKKYVPGTASSIPLLLYAARFIWIKGLLNLLNACRLVVDRKIKFQLLCLGSGPLESQAKAVVKRLSLDEYVVFPGHIAEEKMPAFYSNCTMLVFPTCHEGFSMTIFQSVAAGLPIITTRIAAAADLLKEPDNCLWVEPENAVQLADKICFLLDHPELQAQMADNNRKFGYSITGDVIAREQMSIYEKIMKDSTPDKCIYGKNK